MKTLNDIFNREKFFQNRDWSADERSIFLQEKYFLSKKKTLLKLEQQRIANLKISLENRQTELNSLCQKPDSQKKIELIADAILRELKAVQLVAYCPDDCLEMEKTWSLMSELDKDALIRKKILREL